MKQPMIFLLAFLLLSPLMFSQSVQKHELVKRFSESDPLKLGEEIVFDDFSVKFIKVISDSRCPESVTCIWAGEAEVLLGITFNRSYFEQQITVTGKASEILESGNFRISLEYLDPYPVTPKKILTQEYSIGLQLVTAP
jgi:hypothetical protein